MRVLTENGEHDLIEQLIPLALFPFDGDAAVHLLYRLPVSTDIHHANRRGGNAKWCPRGMIELMGMNTLCPESSYIGQRAISGDSRVRWSDYQCIHRLS
jgi:hypothetical protein